MSVAKLLGVVGIGAMGLGGIYLASNISYGMPQWRPLNEDNEYWNNTNVSNDYKSKYSETYSKYLVGVGTAKTGTKPESNDDWWKWSYENRYLKNNTDLKDKFSTVKQAAGDDASNPSLKSICKEAYKEKLNGASGSEKIKASITTNSTTDFLESNIWLFCSPAEAKIKTIQEAGKENAYTDANSYGKTYKDKLVAIEGNDWFWNFKQQEYEASDPKDTQITPKVKDWCSSSYSKSKEVNESNPKSTDVFKWCSLSGTAPTTSTG